MLECLNIDAQVPVGYNMGRFPYYYTNWECGQCENCIANEIGRKLIGETESLRPKKTYFLKGIKSIK